MDHAQAFTELMQSHRSVRRYRPDPLPEVAEAQAAVDPTLAPSSSAPTVSASDGVPPEASSDDAGPVDPGAGPRADA